MFLYRLLLRLYSAKYRYDFGSEMLVVFRQAAAEHQALGRLSYLRFLAAEFAGLVKSSLSERHFHPPLMPVCGGIAFAALVNYFFYSVMFRLLIAVDRALYGASLPPADPMAISITISMFGTAVLLVLLPLFIFLGARISRRLP